MKSIADQEKPKRKTRTSSEVKARYDAKTYDRITIKVRKETAAIYKEKCQKKGIPLSQPLHEAIQMFIEKE